MAKIRKLSNNQVVKDFEPGEILYVRDADDEGEERGLQHGSFTHKALLCARWKKIILRVSNSIVQ